MDQLKTLNTLSVDKTEPQSASRLCQLEERTRSREHLDRTLKRVSIMRRNIENICSVKVYIQCGERERSIAS